MTAGRVKLISSKSEVYSLRNRNPVGYLETLLARCLLWTVLIGIGIGQTGFDTTTSIPNPTPRSTCEETRVQPCVDDEAWRCAQRPCGTNRRSHHRSTAPARGARMAARRVIATMLSFACSCGVSKRGRATSSHRRIWCCGCAPRCSDQATQVELKPLFERCLSSTILKH